MRHLRLEVVGRDTGELIMEVARRAMIGSTAHDVEVGAVGRARLGETGDRAPRVERAARGDADERRRLALDAIEPLAARAAVDARQRGQQAERVRMARLVEQLVDGADLRLPAGV